MRALQDAVELRAIGIDAETAADAAGIPGQGARVEATWRALLRLGQAIKTAMDRAEVTRGR